MLDATGGLGCQCSSVTKALAAEPASGINRWSSLRCRTSLTPLPRLAKLPIDPPANSTRRVNQPESEKELDAVRHSIRRSSPFGGDKWTAKVVAQLGLESTLRPRGRPRKKAE